MNDDEKLLRMKGKVDIADREVAECDGQLKGLHKRMKDESKCDDLKSADRKLTKMDKDLEAKERQLTDGITQLESKYEW